MVITREIIENIMPGKWYIEPEEGWSVKQISENRLNCKKGETLFIAMDKETWLKGTSNSGVYAKWEDTHKLIHDFSEDVDGIIAQYPIENLPRKIPQYIVENSYNFISHCAEYVRNKVQSKVISITGTVGKTSTKNYLKQLLKEFGTSYATHGNHNSRTGVKLTLSNAIFDPDYLVLETAMTALTMKSGGISQLARPDIAIITQVGVGQKGYDEQQTADFKSRIADGLNKDGVVIINRDIQVYEQLCQYVKRYHPNILSYGQNPNADIHFKRNEKGFCVQVKNKKYQIDLDHFCDEGTLSNMVAAIAVLACLDLDVDRVKHLFNSFSNKGSTLEVDYIEVKNITIIDDTYNAEYLSMLNAFKYCRERFSGNRKILIVGDIINLEKKSKQVHEDLLQPILENDFSYIATFGKDTIYLNQLLPKEKNLGHFSHIDECVNHVKRILAEKDVVLVKGSRRNSTIHQIPALLKKQLFSKQDQTESVIRHIVAETHQVNLEDQIWKTSTEYGIGSLVLIYLALKKYALDKIQINSVYQVSANVDREGKTRGALGLKLDEKYNFIQLLQYVILTQKSDCILALAELLYSTTNKALAEIRKEAELLGLDPSQILNITGRNLRDQTQYKSFKDIYLVAKKIFDLPIHFRKLFFVDFSYFKGSIIYSVSTVADHSGLTGFLFIGDQYRRIYIGYSETDQIKIGIFSITKDFEYIEYLLPYYQVFDQLPESKKIIAKKPHINILGDTYFGEAYTEIRKKRDREDALQKYGYSHSFENIADFFASDEINIANFEAVFNDGQTYSPLDKIKPFILGANSEKTLKELKKRNINHVVLANNHLKDYGTEQLIYTLEQFKQANIEYIGAGKNQKEAHEFFEIKWKDKTYVIFNGYWHRDTAYQKFDFYALGQRSGVACSHGIMLEQISQYKAKYPQHKIIVINHWGIDFKPIQPEQERLAELLIQFGTDLIIGHGPHTIQPIKYINGKPVVFSIGNGVFNSNGEYDKHQAAPYGYIVKIDMDEDQVKLYPIYTNNLKTFWQPYPVNQEQFKEIERHRQDTRHNKICTGIDQLGQFIELSF